MSLHLIDERETKGVRSPPVPGGAAWRPVWRPGRPWPRTNSIAGGLTFRDFSTQRQRRELQPRRPDDRRRAQPGVVEGRRRRRRQGSGAGPVRARSGSRWRVPLGWQATEDWERGVAYSSDKRYRLIVWRVDFAYEGVKDAEHYAATKAGVDPGPAADRAGPGPQAGRRHVPDRLRECRQGPGRRRTEGRVRPGDRKSRAIRRRASW